MVTNILPRATASIIQDQKGERWQEFLRLNIACRPRVKARPRVLSNGRAYTPKHTREFENLIAYEAKVFMAKRGLKPTKLPVKLATSFFFSLPDRIKEARTGKLVKERELRMAGHVPPGKPYGDLTNLKKAVEDGLNGVAYDDDTQIIAGSDLDSKRFGYGDGVQIILWTLVK